MNPKQHPSPMKSAEKGQEKPPASAEIGGREFGQVVEPMQAQMASGNEGLTEKSASKPKGTEKKKKGRKAA